jgi:hypothetical protein
MKTRCVLLYSPNHSPVVTELRRRGIDARQCFNLSEVVENLAHNDVCAVVLAPNADPETNHFVARALGQRHPEVTLVAIGQEVRGVSLHLSWPLPERAVFLQWLCAEGAPLAVDDEVTERSPSHVFTNRSAQRTSLLFDESFDIDVEAEDTLREGDLETVVDALRTEILLSAR